MRFKIYVLCAALLFGSLRSNAQTTSTNSNLKTYGYIGALVVVGITYFIIKSKIEAKQEAKAKAQADAERKAADEKRAADELALKNELEQAYKSENIKKVNVAINPLVTLGVSHSFDFEVEVIYSYNNKEYQRRTTARNAPEKLAWEELEIQVVGGTCQKNTVTVNKNLAGCKDGKLIVNVSHKSNMSIKGIGTVSLESSSPLTLGYYGASGEGGDGGRDGMDSYASNNGCERRATIGGDGGDGQNGENGPNVTIYAKKVYNKSVGRNLLYFTIINETKQDTDYVITDTITSLKLVANGGYGGYGGRGGNGGNASSTSTVSDVGINSCPPERAGNGGDGGNGGDAGKLVVYLDPSINLTTLHIGFENKPGDGGYPGDGGRGGTCFSCEDGANGQAGRGGYTGRKSSGEPIIKKSAVSNSILGL